MQIRMSALATDGSLMSLKSSVFFSSSNMYFHSSSGSFPCSRAQLLKVSRKPSNSSPSKSASFTAISSFDLAESLQNVGLGLLERLDLTPRDRLESCRRGYADEGRHKYVPNHGEHDQD